MQGIGKCFKVKRTHGDSIDAILAEFVATSQDGQ